MTASASDAQAHRAQPSAQALPPQAQFQPASSAGEQVAIKIQQAVGEGSDRITVQLDPADLGRVDVRMEVAQDGKAQLVVTAENRDTLDMLQRDARQLERALQQAGLDTDSGSMEFNLGQQQAEQEELARNSHSDDHGQVNRYGDLPMEEEEAHYVDPFTGRYTVQVNEGVDIKA